MNELKSAILFLQSWSERNNREGREEIRALRLDCEVQSCALLCLRREKENHILIINGKWGDMLHLTETEEKADWFYSH